MSKRRANKSLAKTTAAPARTIEAFSFGDPEPVLDRGGMLDLAECWHNQRWYEPPISLHGLARAFNASPHHSSAILLKRNMLAASLEPSALLSRRAFMAVAQDYLIFGNAYFEIRRNRFGDVMSLSHAPAKYVRRGVKHDTFWWVATQAQERQFPRGGIYQLAAPDINQELYGVPEYLSALQSALLNENATLFRRRYFLNGSHAGYILYATGDFAEGDVDAMRDALKNSKGPGNFRNLFVQSTNGKQDGIRLIPIAEVAAKDDFLGIKSTTRDDVLAAHRVPPQLLGVVPANAGGFGDISKASEVFHQLEIAPLQAVFAEVNDALGMEAITFREFVPLTPA